MLRPEFYETAGNPLSKLINSTENWIIQDIARRISKTTQLTETAEYQLTRLADIQEIDTQYKTELARLTQLTELEIDHLYEEASTQAHVYDSRLFEAKGIPFIPYAENAYLQQLMAGISAQTKQEFRNLSRTMGFIGKNGQALPPRDFFIETLDDTVFQIATGVRDYNSAIREAVKTMTQGQLIDGQRVGGGIVNYISGRNERIDSVMRRNVISGVKQISHEISHRNAQQLGLTTFEISFHDGFRPSHGWGGLRYDTTGVYYPTSEQLFAENGGGTLDDANCRHDVYGVLPEMPPVYTAEQLKEMNAKNAETKTYITTWGTSRRDPDNPDKWLFRMGDKRVMELTYRDQLDRQREMERQMRTTRRTAVGYREARLRTHKDEDGNTVIGAYEAERARYYTQRAEYKAFSRKMGIDEQFERVYLDMIGRL